MLKKNKVIIIAEAGVNHDGKIEKAIKLIDEAAKCGADYIKFQHTNPNLISSKAKKAKYQIKNTKKKEKQKVMIEKLHIDWKKAYPILLQRCKKKKIKFLTSTFSKKDYEKVKPYNLDYIKIPSGEIVNTPLLETVSKSKKTILLSTGMSTVKDISKALNILNKKCNVKKRVILLHCVSNYPTQFKNVNLMSIPFLKKKFFLNVGLSDHSLGIEVSIAAVALGARVIEKHFTLNKKSFGPDHSSSLEPHELKNMIASIRNIELAIGKEEKIPNREEIETKKLVRQSVHAIKNIEKGEEFTKLNISLMRPDNGLNPDQLQKLIGKKSKKKFYSNDPIK